MEFFEDLITASLKQPKRVVRSAWLGHIPFAFYVVAKLRPAQIVELGAHNAASFAAFCQAFHEAGLTGNCAAVDTWEGDIHADRYDSKVFDDVKAFFDGSGWSFASLMRCTFDDALTKVADGSVDLLHIDGLHTLEAVTHDFETWKPKLSDRGVVLFHDIAVKRRGFGVHLLWDKLAAAYPSFRFDHAYGLGVLGVGRDQTALAPLFEAQKDAARAARVKRYFQYAGDRIEQQQRINEAQPYFAAQKRNTERSASIKVEPVAKGNALSAKTAIVISHYNARPTLSLDNLIEQIQSDDSTVGSQLFVVVNNVEQKTLTLKQTRRPVSVLYRGNTGMNIGAWDHGWRAAYDYGNFIFLQDECQILQKGWLDVYLKKLSELSIGLIGESIGSDMTWDRFLRLPNSSKWQRIHDEIKNFGIELGPSSRHLQSLIWAARRDVLERIGGFPIGVSKIQCIGSEVGVSLKVQTAGLRVELVGARRFECISHPQWNPNAAQLGAADRAS